MSEPLVLIPGMMCDARVFSHLVTTVSVDRAVMVMPLVGERIEDMAAAVLTVAPTRFALAGFDMGGMVAMDVLRRASDRVTRVAFMGTTPLAESPQHAAAREPMMVAARAGRLRDMMEQLTPPSAFAPGTGRAEAQNLIYHMAEALGAERFVAQTRALQRRRDQQATLRKIRQPTLVLCGEHEQIYSVKRHRFMADLIPFADLSVIENAGHFPTIEQPEACLDALRTWMETPLVLR